MTREIKNILLIDDNMDDNFYHQRVIKKSGIASNILIKESAKEAIRYLQERTGDGPPDLIFLDINMPGMNGWEFLEEYSKLDKNLQSKIVITMLSTSENNDDKTKALSYPVVAYYKSKPLTTDMLKEIQEKYFY
jgi:response regulator RpfG family c-di-GMP phosphodiesterase